MKVKQNRFAWLRYQEKNWKGERLKTNERHWMVENIYDLRDLLLQDTKKRIERRRKTFYFEFIIYFYFCNLNDSGVESNLLWVG